MKDPKQEAKELVEKFYQEIAFYPRAKRCALVAVDRILETNPNNLKSVSMNNNGVDSEFKWMIGYWLEVKTEITKL